MKLKAQLVFILLFFWYPNQTEAQIFYESTFFAVSKTSNQNQNTLHQYNAAINQWSLIGPTGASNIDAIAMDNMHQTLYAANGGILGMLNMANGAFTPIGTTNYGNGELGRFFLNNIDGLTFCPLSNTLYASHHRLGDYERSNDLLFKINPSNGEILQNAMIDSNGNVADYAVIEAVEHGQCCKLYGSNDLALHPFTQQLYTIQSDKNNNEILTIIDISTAQINSVVYDLNDYESKGLTFSNYGELFGSSELSNKFLIINTNYEFVQPLATFDYSQQYEEFNSIAYAGPYNDLALKITLHPDEQPPFIKDDLVTCSITIYNQGTIEVNEVELINHISEGLSLADSTWVSVKDRKTMAKKMLYAVLQPNDSIITQIQLKVDESQSGKLMNTTEIISAKNNKLLDVEYKVLSLTDVDAAYDEIADNETYFVDDEITQSGPKVKEDEDDHDIVFIEVEELNRNCISQLNLMDSLLNSGTYQAMDEIVANIVIADGMNVNLKAGGCIKLIENFEVQKGGGFAVDIAFCN